MILKDIETKLKELSDEVYFGIAGGNDNDTLWNYIVFNRKTKVASKNKTGYSDYFSVHLVRENFIPEGEEEKMINKMLEISGMRLASTEGTYDYVNKPNTNVVVEAFSVDFVRAKKA